MGMPGVLFKDIANMSRSRKTTQTERATVRRALKLQHLQARDEYIARAGSTLQVASDQSEPDCGSQGQSDPTALPPLKRPKPSPVFRQMLKYNSLQARVIETLWTANCASLGECVEPLTALASTESFRPFYPDPVLPPKKNGNCSYCHQNISQTNWGHGRRATHLLQCHQRENTAHFCFQCAMFVHDKLWSAHQCLDLDERRNIYGVIMWRKLVISEGRCPYGADQYCGKRRFNDHKALKTHIDGVHIEKQPEGAQSCPAEDCVLVTPTKDHLRLHFQETHYIKMWLSAVTISG